MAKNEFGDEIVNVNEFGDKIVSAATADPDNVVPDRQFGPKGVSIYDSAKTPIVDSLGLDSESISDIAVKQSKLNQDYSPKNVQAFMDRARSEGKSAYDADNELKAMRAAGQSISQRNENDRLHEVDAHPILHAIESVPSRFTAGLINAAGGLMNQGAKMAATAADLEYDPVYSPAVADYFNEIAAYHTGTRANQNAIDTIIDDKDFGKAAEIIAVKAAQNADSVAALAVSLYNPALASGYLPVLATSAGGAAYDENIKKGMPQNQAFTNATAKAAIEYVTETIGLDKFTDISKRVLASPKFVNLVGQKMANAIGTIWVGATAAGVEGIEEGAANVSGNVTDIATGYTVDGPLGEQLRNTKVADKNTLEDMLVGLAAGAPGGVIAGMSVAPAENNIASINTMLTNGDHIDLSDESLSNVIKTAANLNEYRKGAIDTTDLHREVDRRSKVKADRAQDEISNAPNVEAAGAFAEAAVFNEPIIPVEVTSSPLVQEAPAIEAAKNSTSIFGPLEVKTDYGVDQWDYNHRSDGVLERTITDPAGTITEILYQQPDGNTSWEAAGQPINPDWTPVRYTAEQAVQHALNDIPEGTIVQDSTLNEQTTLPQESSAPASVTPTLEQPGAQEVATDVQSGNEDAIRYYEDALNRKRTSKLKLAVADVSEVRSRVPALQRIGAKLVARAFGHNVVWLKDLNGSHSFANGAHLRGVDNENFYLNLNSNMTPTRVLAHELLHAIRTNTPDVYNEMVRSMARYLDHKKANDIVGVEERSAGDSDLTVEEMHANLFSDMAHTQGFWMDVAGAMGEAAAKRMFKTVDDVLTRAIKWMTSDEAKAHEMSSGSAYNTQRYIKHSVGALEAVRKAAAIAATKYYIARKQRPSQDTTGQPEVMESRKRESVGDFEVTSHKDGSITVHGDPAAIREQLPDNIQGRAGKDFVLFTHSDAPRAKAAIEGRNLAYSRGGEVLSQKPMKDGKYIGAPEKFNTPGKVATLRKWLRQLTKEGEAGRFWYENSSKEVLRMVGGDINEARKFVALLAIYSPQAKVDTNSTFALRAWAQYKAGQPINVKTGVMDTKAQEALDDVDAFWSGEKTGNFVTNLLRMIDPSLKQGATIDMWMMRAAQYSTDAPTKTQYAFMEDEVNRIAKEFGWEPQQVQAAIWVAMKARMENKGVKQKTEETSEKKGWISFKQGPKGKVRVIHNEQAHRDNWLKHAFEHDPTKDDTQAAKFDFQDGLLRHIGQVSFEARPGRSTGILPGIHSAPYSQQVEYQQAIQKLFYDENGNDILAMKLGLLVDNNILAPGVWQGDVSPSSQISIAMAPGKGTEGAGSSVDSAQKKALDVYASVLGLVTSQEGVGWHRPFYKGKVSEENGIELRADRPFTPEEAKAVEGAVRQWMESNGKKTFTNWEGKTVPWEDGFAFISSPMGLRLVNFGVVSNKELQSAILKVVEPVVPEVDPIYFSTDGNMPTNNWKENPDGLSYTTTIREAGRSDLLDWARDFLAPRVADVNREFSEKYGWGSPTGRTALLSDRRDEVSFGDYQDLPESVSKKLTSAWVSTINRLGDDAFRYPRSNATSLENVARDVSQGQVNVADVSSFYDLQPGETMYRLELDNPKGGTSDTFVTVSGDAVWINIASFKEGSGGAMIYTIVGNYANNNVGMTFIGDPDGLSDVAVPRRLINMASLATKFGNTEFLKPHPKQMTKLKKYGFAWETGNDQFNLARMLFAAYNLTIEQIPELEGIDYDQQSDTFSRDGEPLSNEYFSGLAKRAHAANVPGAPGSGTIKVAAAIGSMVAKGKGTVSNGRPSSAGRVLGSGSETVRPAGLASPNPLERALYSERRQTDTPEFKRWFDGSKVVDSEGKPLVVYHATKAERNFKPYDFSEFDTQRSELGSHFGTVDQANQMADQNVPFSKKVQPSRILPVYLNIKNPIRLKDLGSFDPDFVLEQLIDMNLITPEKAYTLAAPGPVRGYIEKVQEHLKSLGYDGVVYLNRREGINKNRFGSSGNEDYSLEEWQYQTNDLSDDEFLRDFAPEAKDSYIAFSPDQIKSAIGNNGEFDPETPDIRYSEQRAPLFYSQLSRSIDQAKMDVMPANQWKAWIIGNSSKLGVKADEIQWTGINEWLDTQGKTKVSKADIQNYLDQGGVKVEDVMLGGMDGDLQKKIDYVYSQTVYAENGEPFEDLPEDIQRNIIREAKGPDAGPPTKFSQYVLPGGENYRELLLTLPERKQFKKFSDIKEAKQYLQEIDGQFVGTDSEILSYANKLAASPTYGIPISTQSFRSSHFDQPNILAHVRFNERTDAEGNRVLFIEEIQSDWGQKGKKEGFSLSEKALKQELKYVENKYGDWEVLDANGNVLWTGIEAGSAEEAARKSGYKDKRAPSAPFVTDTKAWTALAVKRMLRYAADNGFDKIAWTTGEQQADRYDLSKQIKQITVKPLSRSPEAGNTEGPWVLKAYDSGDSARLNENLDSLDKLSDFIGKDAADKAASQIEGSGSADLRGLDLKVGGEGMHGYYDQILPQVVRDVLKKLGGGKVESVKLATGPELEQEYDRLGYNKSFIGIERANNGMYGLANKDGEYWTGEGWSKDEGLQKLFSTAKDAWASMAITEQPGITITPEMGQPMPLFTERREDLAAKHATASVQATEGMAYDYTYQALLEADNDRKFFEAKRGVVPHAQSNAAAEEYAKKLGWSVEATQQVMAEGASQNIPIVELLGAAMATTRVNVAKLLTAKSETDLLDAMADTINLMIATRAHVSEIARALSFVGWLQRKGGWGAATAATAKVNDVVKDIMGKEQPQSEQEKVLINEFNAAQASAVDAMMSYEETLEEVRQLEAQLGEAKVREVDAKQAEKLMKARKKALERELAGPAEKKKVDKKVFKASGLEWARSVLKAQIDEMKREAGILTTGRRIDPEFLVAGMMIAADHLESGMDYDAYVKAMQEEFGNMLNPYLMAFYEGARNYPGVDETQTLVNKTKELEDKITKLDTTGREDDNQAAKARRDATQEQLTELRKQLAAIKASTKAATFTADQNESKIADIERKIKESELARAKAQAGRDANRKRLSDLNKQLKKQLNRVKTTADAEQKQQTKIDKLNKKVKSSLISKSMLLQALGGKQGLERVFKVIREHGNKNAMNQELVRQFLNGLAESVVQERKEAMEDSQFNSAVRWHVELMTAHMLMGWFTHKWNVLSTLANVTMDTVMVGTLSSMMPGGIGLRKHTAVLAGLRKIMGDMRANVWFNLTSEFTDVQLATLLSATPEQQRLMLETAGHKWMDTSSKRLPGTFGKVIRTLGFSTLGAEDAVFKTILFSYELAKQRAMGLPEDHAAAIKAAKKGTFTDDLTGLAASVSHYKQKYPALGYLVLFIKTLVGVVKSTLEYFPPTGAVIMYDSLIGRSTVDARNRAWAKMLVGTGLAMLAILLGGDDDEDKNIFDGFAPGFRKKEAWLESHANLGIRIGDTHYDMSRLDTVMGPMGLTLSGYKALKSLFRDGMTDADVQQLFGEVVSAFWAMTFGKSWMNNQAELIQSLQSDRDPTAFARYARDILLVTLINNGITQAGDMTDDFKRKVHKMKGYSWDEFNRMMKESVMRKIPVARENLDPQLTPFGEKKPNPRNDIFGIVGLEGQKEREKELNRWLVNINKGLKSDMKSLDGFPVEKKQELLRYRKELLIDTMSQIDGLTKEEQRAQVEKATRAWGKMVTRERINADLPTSKTEREDLIEAQRALVQ